MSASPWCTDVAEQNQRTDSRSLCESASYRKNKSVGSKSIIAMADAAPELYWHHYTFRDEPLAPEATMPFKFDVEYAVHGFP